MENVSHDEVASMRLFVVIAAAVSGCEVVDPRTGRRCDEVAVGATLEAAAPSFPVARAEKASSGDEDEDEAPKPSRVPTGVALPLASNGEAADD